MFARKLVPIICLAASASASKTAPPNLSVEASLPALNIAGEPGNVLKIEVADDLLKPAWETLGSMVLTNRITRFTDVWCGPKPRRFYRITERAPGEPERAPNFRLIDHEGRSHELHYFEHAQETAAMVLIFSANGCAELADRWPAIKALHDRFAPDGIKFWMINSNPADTRTQIAAEAARLAAPFPILHDASQTVARVYGVSQAAEAVVIQRESMGVIYRGAIDDRQTAPSGSATRSYLEEALEAALAGSIPQTLQAKASGCDLPLEPASDTAYATAIAPLLQAKCVSCHSPGNVAPWAMTNHAIVQAYAPLMVDVISTKEMPPWHADPEHGQFQNDISLSTAQERMLVQWLLAGAPRGSGLDPLENVPPPPPRWPVELGEPDMILRPPQQAIDANGVEPYRYIFVDTGLTEARWLKAAVVKPTNTRVVHHYIVWEGRSMSQMAAGLAGYVPGMKDTGFPDGTGIQLAAGSSLTFNLHYTPTGKPETDQPELALWFHDSPPAKTLYTLPLLRQNFVIPAGARDHQVSIAIVAMPSAVTVHSFSPHMHLRGKRMRFEMVHADGRREVLLNVPNYDFNWQTRYELAAPRIIPKGVRVELVGGFDNSDLNFYNPDPSAEVRWGEQSWEEMFIGYFNFTFN